MSNNGKVCWMRGLDRVMANQLVVIEQAMLMHLHLLGGGLSELELLLQAR